MENKHQYTHTKIRINLIISRFRAQKGSLTYYFKTKFTTSPTKYRKNTNNKKRKIENE